MEDTEALLVGLDGCKIFKAIRKIKHQIDFLIIKPNTNMRSFRNINNNDINITGNVEILENKIFRREYKEISIEEFKLELL